MQKKHFVMLGIILFAGSIFPWNTLAYDDHYEEHHPGKPPLSNWTKEKERSGAYQAKKASNKKQTAKRKP